MTESEKMVGEARSDAVVLPRPDLGALAARGEDRLRLLHNVLTNEVAGLPPGGGTRALLLDHKGRTLADLHLLVEEQRVLLVTEAERVAEVQDVLDGYVIADDVELEAVDDTVVSIVGARAEERAEALGLPAPTAPYRHAAGGLAGQPLRSTRLPLQNLASVDLVVSRDSAEAVIRALTHGGLARAPEALGEILRVESGHPRWGREIRPDVLAMEARLSSLLHPTKGCYVGQETVVRAQARGRLNWGLWGLRLPEGAPPPPAGTEVLAEERVVGRVTSAVHSPTLGRAIALARLRREVSEPGRVLSLAGPEGLEVAVSDLPFVS